LRKLGWFFKNGRLGRGGMAVRTRDGQVLDRTVVIGRNVARLSSVRVFWLFFQFGHGSRL